MKSKERRRQILESALEVFVSKGYHLARTKDIASQAGISEPLIYKHYGSKKDLYTELLEEQRQRILNTFDQAAANLDAPADILRAFGVEFYRAVVQSKEVAILVFQSFSEVGMPEIYAYSRETQQALHQRVVATIRRGVEQGTFRPDLDVELSAWRFLSIGLTMAMLRVLELQDQLPPEKVLVWGDALLETFLIKE